MALNEHSLSGDGPVKVFPPQIEFHDAEPNTLYVMTVFIQNVTKQAARIRFRNPKSDFFTLNYLPTAAIAPGLEVRAEVEFCIPEGTPITEFHDNLVVVCGDHEYEVALRGTAPGPRLEIVGGGLLDLGTVLKGAAAEAFVEVRNVGSRPAELHVTGDFGPGLTVSPTCAVLAPLHGPKASSSLKDGKLGEKLRIEFSSDTVGAFRSCVHFEISGQPAKVLDVCAAVVEQSLELVLPNNGGKADSKIIFGSLYFGEKSTRTLLLVNNSPQASEYCITFRPGNGFELYKDAPRSASGEDDEVAHTKSSSQDDPLDGFSPSLSDGSPMAVGPCEGVLNPYEKIPISLCFTPKPPRQLKGFKTRGDLQLYDRVDISLDIMISSAETGQNIPIALVGTACKPEVHVTRKVFRFGSCPTNDRRDISFSVTNKNGELPVRFSLNKVAFFTATPSSGSLLPGESADILLTFRPAQMGTFKTTIHLVLNKGVGVIPLGLSATCEAVGEKKVLVGGPDATVSDFQSEPKFVDPAEARKNANGKARFARIPPWEKKKMAMREARRLEPAPVSRRRQRQQWARAERNASGRAGRSGRIGRQY